MIIITLSTLWDIIVLYPIILIFGLLVGLGLMFDTLIKDEIYRKIRGKKARDEYNEWFEAHEERYHSKK